MNEYIIFFDDHQHDTKSWPLAQRDRDGRLISAGSIVYPPDGSQVKTFFSEETNEPLTFAVGTAYRVVYNKTHPEYQRGNVVAASGVIDQDAQVPTLLTDSIQYEQSQPTRINGRVSFEIGFISGITIINADTEEIVYSN